MVQDINKSNLALATDFAGPDDPAAYAVAYSKWADTSTGLLKRRNASNTAWVVESSLGVSGGLIVVPSAPLTKGSNVVFAEDREQVLIWKTIGAFTGYVSPDVGRLSFGTQPTPRPFEVDAIGQTIDKTTPKYAALYAWANASGLFVSSASWAPGTYYFAEMGGNLFKVPDLRNMFVRFTGTNIDTANARPLGSVQLDAAQLMTGNLSNMASIGSPSSGVFSGSSSSSNAGFAAGGAGQAVNIKFNNAVGGYRTSSESRSINVAFFPRLHV